MKTKKPFIVCVLLIFAYNNIYSQLSNGVELKKSSVSYFCANNKIYSLKLIYRNCSKQTMWLWIDKNDISSSNPKNIITRYFICKSRHADFSLYELGLDGNVSVYPPIRLFSSFVKQIQSNEAFSIEIVSRKYIPEIIRQKIFTFFEKRVVVYSLDDILTYLPAIKELNQAMFYKDDFITLSFDMIRW
jgi:hypothetical protein